MIPSENKVVVVGLGYVGLPSAAIMANAGWRVHGVDVNEGLVAELQQGKCRIGEAEVQNIVSKALKSGRLSVSTTAEAADIFIICVPTPITDDNRADLSMVQAAAEATSRFVKPGNLVILESTSPIGTTENVIGKALRAFGLNPYTDVDVAYCPERVFPGATVSEILNNDRVIGGLTTQAALRAKRFYEAFCHGVASTTTAAAAEFSKLMENTYRDVNIALANVFGHVAECAGVDVMAVIESANRHPRVNVHLPGPGVGGHCIPVDPHFLVESFPRQTALIKMSRDINDSQADHIVDRLVDAGLPDGAKVALLGAAYRGNIDDARETPTELLIHALANRGLKWAVHDPLVKRFVPHGDINPHLTNTLDEAIADVDALVVVTDHDEYRDLSPFQLGGMKGRLVYDTRRIVDDAAFLGSDWTLLRVGAPSLNAAVTDA